MSLEARQIIAKWIALYVGLIAPVILSRGRWVHQSA